MHIRYRVSYAYPYWQIVTQKFDLLLQENIYTSNFSIYQLIPKINSFLEKNDDDRMEEQIRANYRQIKQDIVELVENELIHIENDPALKHLLGDDEGAQAQA